MNRRWQGEDSFSAIYKGVWYSLERQPGSVDWIYTLKIGQLTRTGRVEARLSLLAIRRIKLVIDREFPRNPRRQLGRAKEMLISPSGA